MALLRFLASQPRPVTGATIVRELGIPRSSAYHLLASLRQSGFVVYLHDERRYGLGIAAFEIGTAFLRREGLQRLARPKLLDLAERTGATAHFGILDGREVLYLLKEQSSLPDPLVTKVGVRLPAHLTASGRCLLSFATPEQVRALYPTNADLATRTGRGPATVRELLRVLEADRERGWSMEEGEISEPFASVAAPSLEHNERPVASVAVTFHRDRASEGFIASMAEMVRNTADQLTGRWHGR